MSKIEDIIINQREYFFEGKTKSLGFRIQQLKLLRKIIIRHEEDIMLALKKDLNKSKFETYETEIGFVLSELSYVIKNLPKWARCKRVRTPLTNFLSTSYSYPEPYGVTLIMSPWNYPFQLTITPLIGSIAAGNCTILKPSAYSPNTSNLIDKLIGKYYDKSFITVVKGGREANNTLLEQKFDYIFFTGSVAVGKIVMKAASKHLTPVTLELGGKSPCIVDKTANIDLSAKRIIWGKLLNAGQTCIAPDYVFVHESVKDKLIDRMKNYIHEFYGNDISNNPEYPKIISEKHFNRLNSLIENENILFGGESNKETGQIAPSLLDNVSEDSPVMKEEIFGPILPILEYKNINNVINFINNRPKALALYLFSNNKAIHKKIIKNISFGGGCINDTIVHFGSSYMPFGGVGESGMGGYHGKTSFDTFSHKKSLVKKSNLVDLPLRYPPYKNKLKILRRFL